MLKKINNSHPAYKELFFLFQNNHYVDSYVALDDLLNPTASLIYTRVDASNLNIGEFKTFFEDELDNFPNEYLNLAHLVNNRIIPTRELNDEEKFEQFYTIADITFYAPSIINEDTTSLFNLSDDFTLVPGVINGDSGLGHTFYGSSSSGWAPQIIDDIFVENNFTIIIEPNYHCSGGAVPVIAEIYGESECSMYSGSFSGGDINAGTDFGGPFGSGVNPDNSSTSNQYTGDCNDIKNGDFIRQVFIGHIRCTKQYDALISFTGNGGGSELQFTRTDSRENLEGLPNDSNVDVYEFTERFEIYKSRYAIYKKRERWYSVAWDFNWECADPKHEQLLLIYEKDNTSPIDFDFSGIEWEGQTYGVVSLEVQVRTKNEIIRTWKRDASEFFVTNMLSDFGCGCRVGEFSFSDRCWPRYDCGANVGYTMPHRWVPTN